MKKKNRQKAEKKRDELTKLLRTIQESHEDELNHLASLLAEQKTRVDILNHQLNQMEKERSMVEVDNKTFKRRHGILEDDTYKLKTEVWYISWVLSIDYSINQGGVPFK